MKNITKLLIILIIILFGCNDNLLDDKNRLEIALQLAGENREELEKVLVHYSIKQSDSLKYKAACFLIENMPGYYYYDGLGLDKYATFFKDLCDIKRTPEEILDSLSKVYGEREIKNLNLKYDIHEIDSAYLCDNINVSFQIWEETPWRNMISFDEFCEFILPYRIGNERITDWKKDYFEKTKLYLRHYMDWNCQLI